MGERQETLARVRYGVKLAEGTVLYWYGWPLSNRLMAADCAAAIERLTGEKGEVVAAAAVPASGGEGRA